MFLKRLSRKQDTCETSWNIVKHRETCSRNMQVSVSCLHLQSFSTLLNLFRKDLKGWLGWSPRFARSQLGVQTPKATWASRPGEWRWSHCRDEMLVACEMEPCATTLASRFPNGSMGWFPNSLLPECQVLCMTTVPKGTRIRVSKLRVPQNIQNPMVSDDIPVNSPLNCHFGSLSHV
jgi:hypothetical protein